MVAPKWFGYARLSMGVAWASKSSIVLIMYRELELEQESGVSSASAAGERAAVRGYGWQYDQIATLVYEALVDGDFLNLRLTDPDVGLVDDLVLIRQGRTDAYQFKSTEFTGYVTFRGVTREQQTRSGHSAPSLVQALADGWKRLRDRWGNTHVHLATNQLASVNDHLPESNAPDRPSPDHFSAFLNHVLDPLRRREMTIGDVSAGWQPALSKLRRASGLTEEEFRGFVAALHFDFAVGISVGRLSATKRSDVEGLSAALFRRVSQASGVVELDESGVLDLVGWSYRPRLHSPHQFPVDLDTYAPLRDAIGELTEVINRYSCGYLAVVGPPGSGKSTLLSQALTGTRDRVVRYYAYVPGTSSARTRLAAAGFLHDIVVLLRRSGLETRGRELPSANVGELRRQFVDQLDAAGEEFAREERRTLLVVDGLDHVDRDYPGSDGLLAELPIPGELPEGVLVVVGSRTLEPLHAFARQQLDERDAAVDLGRHRLSPSSVLEICRRSSVTVDLGPEVHQRIVELSKGHPLALNYVLNRVRHRGGRSAVDVLADVPAYAGDVAAQYRAVWDGFKDDHAVVEILAVCSRLRIGFRTEWLSTWAESSAVWTFRRKLLYLFRRHHDGWRFFHDSFRQFAADRTALGDDGRPGEAEDARVSQKGGGSL